MGAVCCCFPVEAFEDNLNPSGPVPRPCISLGLLLHAYTALFRRGDVNGASSSIQEAPPLHVGVEVTAPVDNSLSDTYHSPPRPLPYDVDPRCPHSQCDGLVLRHGKASGQFHEEYEPLTRHNNRDGIESITDKWNGLQYEGQSKVHDSLSAEKFQSEKMIGGVAYTLSSIEDEDVCPTCLEEYTPENPRITARCSHCFHLGCIYEWMERSENCPVCGKLMVFNESV